MKNNKNTEFWWFYTLSSAHLIKFNVKVYIKLRRPKSEFNKNSKAESSEGFGLEKDPSPYDLETRAKLDTLDNKVIFYNEIKI